MISDWPKPLNSGEREFLPGALIRMRRLLTLMLVLSRHHIYALSRRGQSRGRVSEPELFEAHSAMASDQVLTEA